MAEIQLYSDEEVENFKKQTPPPLPIPKPIAAKSDEELIQGTGAVLSTEPEVEVEVEEEPITSIYELEQEEDIVDEILQYREDRNGISKDKGAYNFLTGAFLGPTQEINPANIVDDYLDHARGIKNNSVIATAELNWLKSLKDKEEDIVRGRNVNELSADEIEIVNNLKEQRARALRLYNKAKDISPVASFSKRRENEGFASAIGELASTAGVNIMHTLGDPITAATVGLGKLFGTAASTTGFSPFKSAVISAASTAPLEAGASALVDVAVQKAEIEMGARNEIDVKQTATVAGISAVTAGTLSYFGTKSAVTRVDKASRGKLTEAMKRVTQEQVEQARATNSSLPEADVDAVRESLAKGITDTYGEDAIIRSSTGEIKGIDGKIIRESDLALAGKQKVNPSDVEEALDFGTFQRVTAGLSELIKESRAGNIVFDAPADLAANFPRKLTKNEKVSERMLNILTNTSEESLDFTASILGKYGITHKELAAIMFADASWAGRRLNQMSQLSKTFGRAGRIKTANELAEEEAELASLKLGETFKRLENIRRLTLVSGVATAVRNNISQVIRSGTDTLIYGLESAINPRKKFGFKNTLAQLQHTFHDSKDADTVAKFLLDVFDNQKARYFNQYSEVKRGIQNSNPGQFSIANFKNGLKGESPILDTWENTVHVANSLNRYQEFLYRNGMFTASVQRQLFDKGLDLFEVLNSGTTKQNITEDIIAKAVDESLDFTYAAQPKLQWFKTWNNFIVQSGLTLAIPFPRFMFKALEMTYNYNVTGAATALFRMGLAKARGGQISDSVYRQMAEGVAGGTPLIALGYYLRNPDGDHAGSEWYKLKDNLGNEFDARPFFPLTPYLLIGEVIHRIQEERAGKVVDFAREIIPGFTGANFRGSGAIGKFTEDIVSMLATGGDAQPFIIGAKQVGKYLGEALSGYGQPLYQFADMFTSSDQRMREYRDDPEYRADIEGFFDGVYEVGRAAGKGFFEPFKSRLSRVAEAAGFEIDEPYKEDPRFADVPERVMPFMKILFGATLTRVPPKYVTELNRMGFNYVDFMSKTNSITLDSKLNREMGYTLQTEMPENLRVLDQMYNLEKDEFKDLSIGDINAIKAKEVREYISIVKALNYEIVKSETEDAELNAELLRFKRMGHYGRKASLAAFKTAYDGENPNFNNLEDVIELNNFGKNYFNELATAKKALP